MLRQSDIIYLQRRLYDVKMKQRMCFCLMGGGASRVGCSMLSNFNCTVGQACSIDL